MSASMAALDSVLRSQVVEQIKASEEARARGDKAGTLSDSEIGRRLGVSQVTVSRIHRALASDGDDQEASAEPAAPVDVEDLRDHASYLERRVTELLELVADLAQENCRMRRAALA